MIRGVIALFVFAVVLCAIIIIQPRQMPVPVAPPPGADVTRAPQTPLLAEPPVVAEPATAPLRLEPAEPAAPKQAVVVPAAAVAPLPAPTPAVSRVAPRFESPVAPLPASLSVPTSDATLLATTSNILAGLGLEIEAAATPTPRSTAEVLQTIIAGDLARAPEGDAAMERLIVAALQEGRTDAEIDAMLNAAAAAGEVRVPEILVTADGRVDTAVLLKSIVVQATIAAGGEAPAIPDVPAGDGTGVEVRVVQRAAETEQYRFYTVAPGDSLGAIAVKFFGDAGYYTRIFEANRNKLSSPNRIMVGQRLVIPDLADA